MITLYKYLHESLLDDLDDLETGSDDKVLANIIPNDPTFIKVFGKGWTVENNAIISPVRPSSFSSKLPGINTIGPVKPLLHDLNTMIIKMNSYEIRCKGWELSKDTFCNKIVHEGTGKFIVECKNIHDINFDLNSSRFTIPHLLFQQELKNVDIHFNGKLRGIIEFVNEEFPALENVTSNTEILSIHDTFMFDYERSLKVMDSLLATPYKVKVMDAKKGEVEILIKNFKKIHALVNNARRYTALEQLVRIKPGVTINNIINIKGFKDLNFITIHNNLVSVTLKKGNLIYNPNNPYEFEIGGWTGTISKQ